MERISVFLGKYATLGLQEVGVRRAVLRAVKKVTGDNLAERLIEVRAGGVYINATPTLRTAIYLNRRRIEEEVATALSQQVRIR